MTTITRPTLLIKFLLASAVALGLSACAGNSQGSSAPTDQPPQRATPTSQAASDADGMLKKRAGQTLGVSPSQVTISDVEREGGLNGRINFTAHVGRARYGCYVTSGIGGTSDAICTRPGGGGMVNKSNNPLLNEANKLNKK
ncbi:hypothetical protein [Variovorax sp. DXTD-1]|uniref:hypothetical protein n=1 Tax=Variovorax sp. DXTD-1 TaxID=2495592 RepID=UPI000F87662F|nr:hypothetical protein [Variovorax sp. DXTD-1]RST46323.1 hypothetical protein EJI00_21585 [Variovorax sp. DXTD-1]